jgi:hypothetical protein
VKTIAENVQLYNKKSFTKFDTNQQEQRKNNSIYLEQKNKAKKKGKLWKITAFFVK